MAKAKKTRYVSPKGVAVWPKLNEPDTKFKAEGEYTVKLAYDPADPAVQALIKKLEKQRDEEFAAFLSENPKKKKTATAAPVFTEEVDEEGEETGRILMTFKMRASGKSKKTGKSFTMKPDIFDAHKSQLKNPPQIGSGSELRVSFEPSGWFVESAKAFHLSLRMSAVQIIELVEFGVRDADAYGFDEEEDGFAAREEHVTKTFDDADDSDSDADDSDDDDDGDY